VALRKKTTRNRRSGGPQVQSVARAFRVLAAFARSPQPLSLSKLAAAAGIDKSAAQRLSETLLQLGYLSRAPGGLVPGCLLLDRAYDYLRCNPLIARAYPSLVGLRRQSEEQTSFSLFSDLTMLYAVRFDSKEENSYYAYLPGRRIPTYCTSAGRAVMAHLPDAAVIDLIERSDRKPYTPRTTTSKEEARAQVERARRAGYATAVEEIRIGEVAVAAAVLDGAGAPVAAVSLVGSLGEWTRDRFARRFGPMVVETAQAISGR